MITIIQMTNGNSYIFFCKFRVNICPEEIVHLPEIFGEHISDEYIHLF